MTNRVTDYCSSVRGFFGLSAHIDSSDAIMKRNGLGFFELISGQSESLIEVDSTASPITTTLTAALNDCRLISEELRVNIYRDGNSILKTRESEEVIRGHGKFQGDLKFSTFDAFCSNQHMKRNPDSEDLTP